MSVARRALAALVILVPALAHAVEYEIEIDITDEDDLYELWNSEQISEDTFNALLDLLRRGVDLNEADEQELYALPGLTLKDVEAIVSFRAASGKIADPRALVTAGVISDDKLERIAPFLLMRPVGGGLEAAGRFTGRTLWTSEDSNFPATALEARVLTLGNLTVGVDALITRHRLGDVVWDPSRDALSAQAPDTRAQAAKIFAEWRTPKLQVVAGNYRAGFGQRLVFDNTPLVTPNGFYTDEILYRVTDLIRGCVNSQGELPVSPCSDLNQTYVSTDFRYRDSLLGVAAAARQLDAGDGWLQIAAFLSREVHAIYQYEIYDRDMCADPTQNNDPSCGAPAVYKTQDDPLAPAPRYVFQTLPAMWAEPLAGGNVTYFVNRRTHVGVTGYGAKPEWLVSGTNLDFQEWSRFPYGGAYGTAGADAAWGAGNLDEGLEVARSFDGTPTGGGLGAISRTTVTWPKNELELALRYYDQNFANPYSGAIAEPDRVDGQNARDEAGARLRFAGWIAPRVALHTLADFWVAPSSGIPKIRIEARSDYHFGAGAFAGAYVRWQDKNLKSGGYGSCYSDQTSTLLDANGVPLPCDGQKIDLGLIGRFELARRVYLTGQFQLRYVDDVNYTTGFRNDITAWVMFDWWLSNEVRFYARAKYLNEAIDDNTYLEQSLWSYAQLTYRAPRDLMVRLRYDNRWYLDDRKSTMERSPNPENWLRLEVEAKF
jgi:hypothetical protein